MSKSKKRGTCYACERPAVSREHIPPKAFFLGVKDSGDIDYRNNLITVPSCDLHNSSKSNDDMYVYQIILSDKDVNQTGLDQINSKFGRALEKDPTLWRHYVENGFFEITYDGTEISGYKFDYDRFQRTIQLMAKGLYFYDHKEKWMNNLDVYCLSAIFPVNDPDAVEKNQTLTNIRYALLQQENIKRKGNNPKVFYYQWLIGDYRKSLVMVFFSGFVVYVRFR